MKLYLVNKSYYIVCDDYCEVERIYKERFNAYNDCDIKSIELISTYVYVRGE